MSLNVGTQRFARLLGSFIVSLKDWKVSGSRQKQKCARSVFNFGKVCLERLTIQKFKNVLNRVVVLNYGALEFGDRIAVFWGYEAQKEQPRASECDH